MWRFLFVKELKNENEQEEEKAEAEEDEAKNVLWRQFYSRS